MPFAPTAPESVSVATPETKNLDKFRIVGLEIQLDPDDAIKSTVKIRFASGFDDGGGKFQPMRYHEETFTGAPMGSMFASITAEGDSVKVAVRKALWQMLVDEGKLPTGTINE